MGECILENLKRKEAYFTENNIEAQSQKLLSITGQFLNRHHNITYDINKTVLFVLDMQDYFLSENSHAFIPSSKAVLKNINQLIAFFEIKDLPILFSRHIDREADSMMGKWWNGKISRGDSLSVLSEKLQGEQKRVIEKNHYDFFKDTKVDLLLKEKGVESIIITGVMTHLCCETTARTAFMNGYQVFFPIDGTATYNLSFHRATFVNLSHGFVIPTLVKELMD